MQVLRRPCGPVTSSRAGAQRTWLSRPARISPTPLVTRAVGAPADRRRGDASQEEYPDGEAPQTQRRTLFPRGPRGRAADDNSGDGFVGGEESSRRPRQQRYDDERERGGDGDGSGGGYRRREFSSERRRYSENGNGEEEAKEDADRRPSTSGRDRDYGRGGGFRGGYGRRDGDDDGDRRGGDRAGKRRQRRGPGERGEYGGGRGERREGRFAPRRDGRPGDDGAGGGGDSDERRRGDRYDRFDRSERRGGGDRRGGERERGRGRRDEEDREGAGRRRTDRDDGRRGDSRVTERDADAAAPEAAPAPAPVVRPPGSSTGNRPLPYDLPLVRPDDGDKGTFFAGNSWRQVGASEDVVSALKTLGIARPSHIQSLAFSTLCPPPTGSGSDRRSAPSSPSAPVVLADQAGSGKTLAYLLPLMQMLKQEEVAAGGRVTKPKNPRGIVLAPTVELVQQVLRVARALSGAGLRCRTAAFTGGQKDEKARAVSFKTQKDLLSEGVDLVVATPGRLQKHLEGGSLVLDQCRMLVLDEVDVLMGDRADFSSQVAPLRAAAPPSMRLVLVTATLPAHVFAELREVWSDLRTVFGPGLHRTAAGLVEELVDCSGGDEITEESGRKRKLEALKTLLERHRSPRTIVFCNKIDSCRDVENFLVREDPRQRKFRVLPYHEAIRDDLRAESMAEFLKPVAAKQPPGGHGQGQQERRPQRPERPAGDDEDGPGPQQDAEGEAEGESALVLVATDRTSRGIDVLYCEHVVLFDFPRDPSEYVRRVGRTARGAGGRGTVSSLVLGRQVPLAREIIDRNQKGMPLHTVPE